MIKLDTITANRLSSDQVIVDVTSVLKELIENALDAETSSITIVLDNNGLDEIIVEDKGKGMSPEDLKICANRHTTSKISTYEDISSHEDYGFRGEALSSIASFCSKMVIKSRVSGGKGYTVDVDREGEAVEGSLRVTHATVGTRVECYGLFSNTPVRLEHVRKDKKAMKKIYRLINEYCLIQPHIRINLRVKNTSGGFSFSPKTSGEKNHIEAISQVYRSELADELTHFEVMEEIPYEWILDCYVPRLDIDPENCVSSESRNFVYLNFRPIKMNKLTKIFTNAWRGRFSKPGKYPFLFINLQVPAGNYDINLDANKRKVHVVNLEEILTRIKFLVETDLYPAKYTSPRKLDNTPAIFLGSTSSSPSKNLGGISPSPTKKRERPVDTTTLNAFKKKPRLNISTLDDNEINEELSQINFDHLSYSPQKPKIHLQKKIQSEGPSQESTLEFVKKEIFETEKKVEKKIDILEKKISPQKNTMHLDIDLNSIKNCYDYRSNNNPSLSQFTQLFDKDNIDVTRDDLDDLSVVGKISIPEVGHRFIFKSESKLYLCDSEKVREAVVYKDMCENFIPKDWKVLEEKQQIYLESFSTMGINEEKQNQCFELLFDMAMNENEVIQSKGFKVKCEKDENEKYVAIMEVFRKIPNYGAGDLMRYIYEIITYGDSSITPKLLRSYLLKKTMKHAGSQFNQDILYSLLEKAEEFTCPHKKPFFTELGPIRDSAYTTEI